MRLTDESTITRDNCTYNFQKTIFWKIECVGIHNDIFYNKEVIGNLVDKPDGKARSRWKNETDEQKRSEELLQKVILSSQEKQDDLSKQYERLKSTTTHIMKELAFQVNHQMDTDLLNMPNDFEAVDREWKAISSKLVVPSQTSDNLTQEVDGGKIRFDS